MVHGHPVRRLVLVLMLMIAAPQSGAQGTFPTRPIKLIVPLGAGSGPDTGARRLAPRLAEQLGQPVIVENRTGAGGLIGTEAVAKAPNDGYTIGLATISTMAFGALHASLPYDPVTSFAPIVKHYTAAFALLASPNNSPESLGELMSVARQKPGSLAFGSQGNGSTAHLAGELFRSSARVDLQHVPYREFSQIIPDLTAGRIQLFFDAIGAVLGHVQAGKVRALAVSGSERISMVPNVPTFAEAGLPNYDMHAWLGLIAPAGTPAHIVRRLNEAANAAVMADDLQQFAARVGGRYESGSPEQFAQHLRSEIARWTRVIREGGIRTN